MKYPSQSLFRTVLILVLAAGLLSACASTGPKEFKHPSAIQAESSKADSNEAPLPDAGSDSRVSPGNLFRMSSLEDKKLNGHFRVDFDGWLRLPYDVSFKAAGLTLEETIGKVKAGFQPFFKGEAKIQIFLEQRKLWIDVRGLVKKPGKVLVLPDTGLDEVLAMSEGILPNSNVDAVRVDRGSESASIPLGGYFLSGDTHAIPRWVGGERLFFHSSSSKNPFYDENQNLKSIRILGEVRKPGLVPYRKDADFLYYFTEAEGSTAMANLKKIEIVRNGIPHSESVTIDFQDKNEIPKLAPGDMIIVHADRPSALERASPVIASVASVISTILLSVLVFK